MGWEVGWGGWVGGWMGGWVWEWVGVGVGGWVGGVLFWIGDRGCLGLGGVGFGDEGGDKG